MRRLLAYLLLTLVGALPGSAEAAFHFSLSGGPVINKITIAGFLSAYGIGYQGGAGLDFSFGASSPIFLAVGGSYQVRKFSSASTVELKYVDIPVEIRYCVGATRNLCAGAGGYYSKGLSVPSGFVDSDYGIVIMGGFYPGILLLEGRVGYGLSNVADSSALTTRWTTIQLLLGLRFGK